MLKDSFYNIISIQKENSSFKIDLRLNTKHAIFEGHFPAQPVVPGACMLQMVKEMTETVLAKKIRLLKADNIKFLLLISPNEHNQLQMTLTPDILKDGLVNISASLSNGTSVCFKFTGCFQA